MTIKRTLQDPGEALNATVVIGYALGRALPILLAQSQLDAAGRIETGKQLDRLVETLNLEGQTEQASFVAAVVVHGISDGYKEHWGFPR